jgi:hypothetical protein
MRRGAGCECVRQQTIENDRPIGRAIAIWFGLMIVVAIALLAVPGVALAQLNTQHVKGSAGLKAGSQPPPGGYLSHPSCISTTPTKSGPGTANCCRSTRR